jgi:hypothetical protein
MDTADVFVWFSICFVFSGQNMQITFRSNFTMLDDQQFSEPFKYWETRRLFHFCFPSIGSYFFFHVSIVLIKRLTQVLAYGLYAGITALSCHLSYLFFHVFWVDPLSLRLHRRGGRNSSYLVSRGWCVNHLMFCEVDVRISWCSARMIC